MFSHCEQKTSAEGRASSTAAWPGCTSISGGLLNQNDSVFSLGMEGQRNLPQSHWMLRGPDFTQDTRKRALSLSVLKLPIFRAGFRSRHVGVCRAQASLAVNVNAHSQVQACFFWACFHCSEPLQPHPEQSAYPEQIAPSPRQQACSSRLRSAVCPCYGTCLGVVIWWGKPAELGVCKVLLYLEEQ